MAKAHEAPRRASSAAALVAVLLDAAQQEGVTFRITRGRMRAKGPASSTVLLQKLLTHEHIMVDALVLDYNGDRGEPFAGSPDLSDDELRRLTLLRDKLRSRCARVHTTNC